jgi:hypothetical protein
MNEIRPNWEKFARNFCGRTSTARIRPFRTSFAQKKITVYKYKMAISSEFRGNLPLKTDKIVIKWRDFYDEVLLIPFEMAKIKHKFRLKTSFFKEIFHKFLTVKVKQQFGRKLQVPPRFEFGQDKQAKK